MHELPSYVRYFESCNTQSVVYTLSGAQCYGIQDDIRTVLNLNLLAYLIDDLIYG